MQASTACADLSSWGTFEVAGYDLAGTATLGSPYVRRPAKALPSVRSTFDTQAHQEKHKQVHEEVPTANCRSTRSEASATPCGSASFFQRISGLAYGRSGDCCHASLGTDAEPVKRNAGTISNVDVFRREWKKTSKDTSSRFQLLRRVVPSDLPRMFKDEIPVGLLGEILETIWDWQLTLVRLSPEVGRASEQTSISQVDEFSAPNAKRDNQSPLQSGQEFADGFSVILDNDEAPKKFKTALNKGIVPVHDIQNQCSGAVTHTNTKKLPGKKSRGKQAPVPRKLEDAALSRTRRVWSHVNCASPMGSAEELASQSGTEKSAMVTDVYSESPKEIAGQINRRPRLLRNGIQQLIIEPCENLRKFDEVLSRFGILNHPLHENDAKEMRQQTTIALAGVCPDSICASSAELKFPQTAPADNSAKKQNLTFQEREYLSGVVSGAADEQHGSNSSTGHTSARSVSLRADDFPTIANTEQHSQATARAHLVWLFDVLKAITKCGRFSLALKMMGEKARFIVANLLDHFAAGMLSQPQDALSVDSADGVSKEQDASDSDAAHRYTSNPLEQASATSEESPLNSITSRGGKLDYAEHCVHTRFPAEQLKELRVLYRIDMQ